jgi:hypothetical protein
VIAAWVSAVAAVAAILGVLLRLSFQVGSLVARVGDHVAAADKVHADQEARLRKLEAQRGR